MARCTARMAVVTVSTVLCASEIDEDGSGQIDAYEFTAALRGTHNAGFRKWMANVLHQHFVATTGQDVEDDEIDEEQYRQFQEDKRAAEERQRQQLTELFKCGA